MKTLFCIVHFISSLHRGGAETVTLNLARELQQRGWEQTVLYIHEGPMLQELHKLGIPCQQITAPGLYLNPLMWYRLVRAVRTLQPQLISTALWAANFMGRIVGWLLGIPTVASLHAVAEHEGKVRTTIDRLMPITATKTVAVSRSIAASLVAARARGAERIMVISNGIDIAQFQAAATRAPSIPFERSEHDIIIGAVGRLVPVKNFDLLIRVFARLADEFTDLKLLIIGTGPEEERLRALIAQQRCAARITLISGQLAAPYYQYFDMFVQPSAYEGLSLALLEALASRLPVIVTGSDGQHEVVIPRVHGLVIAPNDTDVLEQALREYVGDPTAARELGEAGYQEVMRSYTFTRMIDAYEQLFRDVIEGSLKG